MTKKTTTEPAENQTAGAEEIKQTPTSGQKKKPAGSGKGKTNGKKSTPQAAPASNAEKSAEPEASKSSRDVKSFTKRRAAQAWPEIMETIVDKAKAGSVNHAKFLVDVGGLKEETPKKKGKKEKTLSEVLLDAYKVKKSGNTSGSDAETKTK